MSSIRINENELKDGGDGGGGQELFNYIIIIVLITNNNFKVNFSNKYALAGTDLYWIAIDF